MGQPLLHRLRLGFVACLSAFAILCGGIGLTQPVYAVDLLGGACTSQTSSAAACGPRGGNNITGPNGVLTKVTKLMALLTGIVAVIVIMIGAFLYLTSAGDSSKAKQGRDTIIYAMVGLLVIIVARSIILFVVGRL